MEWITKYRIKKYAIIAIILVACGWFFINRERTQWLDEVPSRFYGTWHLVPDRDIPSEAVRAISLTKKSVTLFLNLDDGERSKQIYPVRKVSITTRRDTSSGELIIFFGEPSKDHIAEERYSFYFTNKQQASVYNVLTYEGGGGYIKIGEFVLLKYSD